MKHRLRTTLATALVALAALTVPGGAAQAGAADRISAPSRPVASEMTETSIALTWEPSAGPVASYTVERQFETAFRPVLSTTTNSAILTGLEPFTVYNLRVVAHAEAGSGLSDSHPSPYNAFRTPFVPESEPPTTPGKPVVETLTTTSARLAFAAATDNARVKEYRVETLRDGVWSNFRTVPDTRPVLDRLSGETSYTVAVVAVDLSGNRSPRSEPLTFTTGPFTAAPSCAVELYLRDDRYHINVILENTTASPLDAPPVTFTMPIEHTVRWPAAVLTRDGIDGTLSWPAGVRLALGAFSPNIGFSALTNGDPTMPADFRVQGSPCGVRLTG